MEKIQAVILAAGKSTRTWPLTALYPKALLELAGKAIIDHTLDAIVPWVDEVIIVVGHGEALLKKHLVSRTDVNITYVKQENINGTGAAVAATAPYIRDSFLILNGDDYYAKEDIAALVEAKVGVLGAPVQNPSLFGMLQQDGNKLTGIIEKPKESDLQYANIGVYLFPKSFLQHVAQIELSPRGELELVDAVTTFVRENDAVVVPVQGAWLPVGYPWDILRANDVLLKDIRTSIRGEVHERAVLEGEVIVEEGAQVLPNVVIQGPVIIKKNAVVGPNCFIRPFSVIGEGAHVGAAVEVKRSVIGNHSKVGHLSYVADSILAESVNFGAGTMLANLRHDFGIVKAMTSKGLVETGSKKAGAFIGVGVRTGSHTTLLPGTLLGTCAWTDAGDVVRGTRKDFTYADAQIEWQRYVPSLADVSPEVLEAAEKLHASQ